MEQLARATSGTHRLQSAVRHHLYELGMEADGYALHQPEMWLETGRVETRSYTW